MSDKIFTCCQCGGFCSIEMSDIVDIPQLCPINDGRDPAAKWVELKIPASEPSVEADANICAVCNRPMGNPVFCVFCAEEKEGNRITYTPRQLSKRVKQTGERIILD